MSGRDNQAWAPLDPGWIDKRFPRSGPGCVCRAGWFDVARAQDMKHRLASGDQVVSDDAPVASPPYGFRAHDSATSRMSQVPQLGKTGAEGVRQGVVGIVVKALVLPESVYRCESCARPRSPPSEGYGYSIWYADSVWGSTSPLY